MSGLRRFLLLPLLVAAALFGLNCSSPVTGGPTDAGTDAETPDGGVVDPSDAAAPDAPAADSSAAPSALLGLTISAGTLAPAFAQATLSYGVVPSIVSLGVPFTVTPTYTSGSSVTINGVAVASGAASAPIALGLMSPTPIDIAFTPVGAATKHYTIVVPPKQEAYAKPSNTYLGWAFGSSVAISGNTLAVGAVGEAGSATGIADGNQTDTSTINAGAVYVFTRTGTTWSQQAYIKASNTREYAGFGGSVALSGDTLVVGSSGESSNATGIDGNQADTSANGAGAVYVFTRTGATWSQQAYIKASNARRNAHFGVRVALAGDTLAVGSSGESSNATGVDGNQADSSLEAAGAVYVFTRTGTTWSQQAYVKASNPRKNTYFGGSLALSGNTLAVGSDNESSNATGVDGDQADTSAMWAGAVYVFIRTGSTWSQQAYVKASNTRAFSHFGSSVALSGDTLAVGATAENSNATGVDGNQADTSAEAAGAVYIFKRAGTTWSQQAYLKSSNTRPDSRFGYSLALVGDTLVAGAIKETSNAKGINGNQADTSSYEAGAAYLFRRTGSTWSQQAYVKASNTHAQTSFGVAVALSEDTLAVSSDGERSIATGVNGDQSNTSMMSGAVYILR